MLDNGTWLHATTCYIPYYGISSRGVTSIIFGVLFGLSIMFALMNLKKHGAQYLREDKRFRLVGRRWQWYWMLFVSASATISLFTGVDVDRYYLQQMPLMLQCFFFTLMVPASLAMVWEATRHWASWEERQAVDADPYGLPQDGSSRANIEFYSPLVFYAFAWVTFFLTIPKSWSSVQKQNSPEQTRLIAQPAATDARNKAGAVLALAAWLTIVVSATHTLRFYVSKRNKNHSSPGRSILAGLPLKLALSIPLLALRLVYGILASTSFPLSLFNQAVPIAYPFALGYAPILLILLVFNVAGWREENEDKQLVQQRVRRGRAYDAELGVVRKPGWWGWGKRGRSDGERVRELVGEVHGGGSGGRPTARERGSVEMRDLGGGSGAGIRQRSGSRAVGVGVGDARFRDESPGGRGGREREEKTVNSGEEREAARVGSGFGMEVSESEGHGRPPQDAKPAPQQRIRSMLDV